MLYCDGRCLEHLVRPVLLHFQNLMVKLPSVAVRYLSSPWLPSFEMKSADRRPKLVWPVGLTV